MSRKKSLALAAAVAVALLLIPIPYLASPEWSVTVVDEAGVPVPGMLVRLDYQNFSVENDSHEQDLTTDANGRAIFPAHEASAATLQRCYYTLRSAMALAHASFGPNAYVNAFGNGMEGSAVSDGVITAWKGSPDRMNSRIVAKAVQR